MCWWEVAFMVGDNVLAPPTRKWEVAFKVGGDVLAALQAPAPWWPTEPASNSIRIMFGTISIGHAHQQSTHDSLLKAARISIPDNPQSSTQHPLTKFSPWTISPTYPRLCSTTTKTYPRLCWVKFLSRHVPRVVWVDLLSKCCALFHFWLQVWLIQRRIEL